MGFAEDNPRQFASTVGKTQVGVTIFVVPSLATIDSATSSMTQERTDLLGTLNLTACFLILRSNTPDRHTDPTQAFGGFRSYIKRRTTRRSMNQVQSTATKSRPTSAKAPEFNIKIS